jgi:hypothetical protein
MRAEADGCLRFRLGGIRSSMVDAEASAISAAIDIVGCCGSIRDRQRDFAGSKHRKHALRKLWVRWLAGSRLADGRRNGCAATVFQCVDVGTRAAGISGTDRPRERRTPSFPTMVLGFTLTVTTLIAAETALGLVFEPRWQDFPFAGLTMAVVPFWTLTLIIHLKSGTRPVAVAVFACLFALATLYITIKEGFHNWQAMWTSAAYFLPGITLWQPRYVSVELLGVHFGDDQ